MSNEEQQKTNYPAAQPGSKQDALQRKLKKMKNINLLLLIYKHIATEYKNILYVVYDPCKKLAFSLCTASFWNPSITHWNTPERKQIKDCVVIVVILVQSTNRNERNAPFTVAAYLRKIPSNRIPAHSNVFQGNNTTKCLFDNHIFAEVTLNSCLVTGCQSGSYRHHFAWISRHAR